MRVRVEGNSQTKAKPKGGDDYTVGYGKPPIEHRFNPGEGGRKKGSRNRLGEAFIEDLYQSWLTNGPAAIEAVLKTKPEAYLRTIASLLPRDLNLNVNNLDHLTDEQLLTRLRTLTEQVAPLLSNLDEAGGENGLEPEASRH
jgi:hypothetical protein